MVCWRLDAYDPCVCNRVVRKKQQTVQFHVDDVLVSHVDPKANESFAQWAQKKYGSLKPVEVHRGKVHDFLGMTLDFSKCGECGVNQVECVDEILSSWLERIAKEAKALTPASNSLFDKRGGRLLSKSEREAFHSTIAKCLFVANCSRPDILPTISVLAGRVSCPNCSN